MFEIFQACIYHHRPLSHLAILVLYVSSVLNFLTKCNVYRQESGKIWTRFDATLYFFFVKSKRNSSSGAKKLFLDPFEFSNDPWRYIPSSGNLELMIGIGIGGWHLRTRRVLGTKSKALEK